MIIGHFLKQKKEGRKNKKNNQRHQDTFCYKERKRRWKKKKQNQKIIKGNIIRDIRTAFEQEEKEESFISLKE